MKIFGTTNLILTYEGTSGVFKILKNNDSALYFAFKAYELAKALNQQSSLPYCFQSIATVYLKMEDYKLAKIYLDKALTEALKNDDKRVQTAIYGNLAAIEIEQNHPNNAQPYVEKLMALQKELNIKLNSEDIYKLYAAYWEIKNDYKSAYENLKRYADLSDSIYNIEANGQLNEMQEKYQSEKKEKENLLLQQENENQKKTRNLLLIILFLSISAIVGALFAFLKIKKTNRLLTLQKSIIEEKQTEILDSIHYAKRIQMALLPTEEIMTSYLPQHFVLFKPKDVVSGDFYWANAAGDGVMLVTADCTGHGVPGAFMSLLNITKLSQVVNEKKITRPDLVLNEVRKEIIDALNPLGSKSESKDGMDAIVCLYEPKIKKLKYAAANNSFYIVRQGKLLVCKADKMPVGKGQNDEQQFSYNELQLQSGDMIYTLTDGYPDQFGGPKGKKFKYKQLEDLLLKISTLDVYEQKQQLENAIQLWKGDQEQVDDICLIGISIS